MLRHTLRDLGFALRTSLAIGLRQPRVKESKSDNVEESRSEEDIVRCGFGFQILHLEFVSDFELRISDFVRHWSLVLGHWSFVADP